MPINLILENLGAKYYTVKGKEFTNNIRGGTIFYPSTIYLRLGTINCSD